MSQENKERKSIIEGSTKALEIYNEQVKKEAERLLGDDKYFTPSIEDFKVGYEFEQKYITNPWYKLISPPKDYQYMAEWKKRTFGSKISLAEVTKMLKLDSIRTQYLTDKQIVSEGWNYKRVYLNNIHFELGDVWNINTIGGFLEYNTETHILKISLKHLGESTIDGPKISTRFNGECKDINTLRIILKLLKIN